MSGRQSGRFLSARFRAGPAASAAITDVIQEELTGIPDRVATAVLRDWHADLAKTKPDPDPDPETNAALSLDKHTLAVTCLDQFEQLSPGEPWTQYYRALAMLESDRAAEALTTLDSEAERNPDCPFPIAMVRAAATAALDDSSALRRNVERVLTLPLHKVDYLTESGLLRLFELFNTALGALSDDDPVRLQAERLALLSGLAPDDYFERFRVGEVEEEISFYTCEFEQPLDSDWSGSPGCLHGQDHWPSYVAMWGVLAHDAEHAEHLARSWQEKCCEASPELIDVSLRDEGFREICGVVWQSTHAPLPDEDDDEDGFGPEFDETP